MSASTIIKRARFDGVEITLSHVGTLKLSGEAANVSKWIQVLTSRKSEILIALEVLAVTRSAHNHHMETCPICSTGWAATDGCVTHAELWQAYEAALVGVHGVEKVLGCDEQKEPVIRRENYTANAYTPNGYRAVLTAQIKPPEWHRARDSYHSHLMTCRQCKPSGECVTGQRLREKFDLIATNGGAMHV